MGPPQSTMSTMVVQRRDAGTSDADSLGSMPRASSAIAANTTAEAATPLNSKRALAAPSSGTVSGVAMVADYGPQIFKIARGTCAHH